MDTILDEDERSITVVSDSELAARVRQGDKSAFHVLYFRHVNATYRYAMSILRAEQDAEEVTQDTWLAFWNARERLELATPSALPWLLVTARHVCLKHLRTTSRRAAREQKADLIRAPIDPALAIEAVEFGAYVDSVIDEMHPTDRALYQLCIAGNVSYRAAAGRLGITEGSVRNRLHRARRTLKTSIDQREVES